jgi:hypothetical protein
MDYGNAYSQVANVSERSLLNQKDVCLQGGGISFLQHFGNPLRLLAVITQSITIYNSNAG